MKVIAYLFYLLNKCGIDTVFANIGTTELEIVNNIPDMFQVKLCLSEGVIAAAMDGYYRINKKSAVGIFHTGVGIANGLSAIHNANCSSTSMFNIVGDVKSERKYKSPLRTDMKKIVDCIGGNVLFMNTNTTIEEIWKFVNNFYQFGGIYTVVIPEDFDNKEHLTIEEQYKVLLKKNYKCKKYKEEQVELVFEKLINYPSDKVAIYLSDYYYDVMTTEGYEISKRYDLYCSSFPTKAWIGENCVQKKKMPYFSSDIINSFSRYEYVICFIQNDEILYGTNFINSEEEILNELYDKFEQVSVEKDELIAIFRKLLTYSKEQGVKEKKEFRIGINDRFNILNINNCIASMIQQDMVVIDESNSSGGAYYMLAFNSKKHCYLSANQGGAIGVGASMAFGVAVHHEKVVCLQSDGSMFYNMSSLWSCVHYNMNVTLIIFQNNEYGILQLERNRKGKDEWLSPHLDELTNIKNPYVDWESIAKGFGANVLGVHSIVELKDALTRAFQHCGTDVVVIHLSES